MLSRNNLHIAIVHDRPLPALKYGGTERVIWWLTQTLISLGHRVTLIAPENTHCRFANVITRPSKSPLVNDLIPPSADVVHSFATLDEEISKPLIVTIGGNGKPGEKFHPNTVFVSKNHAGRHGSDAFVYNGLNPDEYPVPTKDEKENFCFFLAKARWKVKNVKGAIKVARSADMPLKIMGGWRPSLNKKIMWLGMIGGEKKMNTLKRGSYLLFPVRWNEPFGLAIIESLVTGSPVFGTPYGSLPELVKEEYGFLSKNSTDIASALKRSDQYSIENCRNYVLDNFTNRHMAEKYLNFYEHVLQGKYISKREPETILKSHPEELLDFY